PPADGLPALRTAIAAHLQVARGIHCTPDQVFITSGYRESLNLVIQALLQPGDQVWVEDPGYPPTRELLKHSGLTFAPVEVDS
ncbi:aminotransferase class I/II-fold pyridoxal phosphate-dependent enzyme, partial [Acinetobacter baumannii]